MISHDQLEPVDETVAKDQPPGQDIGDGVDASAQRRGQVQ